MARAHFVRKARKDNPAVKVGEPYWWWRFWKGPKIYSATRPTRSQLTRSSFFSSLYDIEDRIGDCVDEADAGDLVAELECLRDECQESLDNMPWQLRETSESGMLLYERIEGLDEWIAEIEDIDWTSMTPEEAAQYIQDTNPGFD